MKPVAVGGLPFRMCLFFASNPDEHLLSSDIAQKYRVSSSDVWKNLSTATRNGWLAREPQGRGCRSTTIYRAGPNLLQAIGL